MSNSRILLIVEGEKTETAFITRLTELYGMKYQIYTVGTNLFALYDKVKRTDFQCDIKDILREFNIPEEQKEMLREDFAYTYLIFDSELQDKRPNERQAPPPLTSRINRNIDRLIEMAGFFNDETDPSKGKLYINYPMMESYRDADAFYDDQFIYNTIALEDIPDFKKIASSKHLAGFTIQDYTKENYTDLMRMHVDKLAFMSGKENPYILPYSVYLTLSPGEKIADIQKRSIMNDSVLHILNTSLFFLLDYYPDLYLERPCQSACVYRIGVQHLCVLDKQPSQYPLGQSCLCIAVLADLRRDRAFMGRTAERVDHADLDSGVYFPLRLEGFGGGFSRQNLSFSERFNQKGKQQ